MWKNSIRNKLMVFLLAATVIPIATSVVFSYVYTKNAMEDKSIRENARLMFQGKTNLIHYFNILNQTSMTAYTGSNMNNTLFHILQGGDSDYLSRNEIYRSLQYMANSIEDIHQIYLYMEKSHRSYLLVQNRLYPRVSADIHEYFNEREMSRVQVLPTRWSRLYGTNPYPPVAEQRVISMVRPIFNVPKAERLGLLVLDVRLDFIREIAGQLYSAGNEDLYVLDESGTVVYASREERIGTRPDESWVSRVLGAGETSGHFRMSTEGEPGIAIYEKMETPYLNWTLVKHIPYSFLHQDARQLTMMNSLIILSFLVVAIIATLFISYRFTEPIKQLIRSIQKVETGNLDVSVGMKRTDEIGILSRRFDQMVRRLNQLLFREFRLEIANKTNQLKALQAQINPHFIYNALQSIGTLALQKNERDIYRLVFSLGKMMRYHVNTAETQVPLSKELEHVQAYFQLQNQRFEGNLEWETDIPEQLRSLRIPKMTLQPIVENFFKHGFQGGDEPGRIRISGRMEGTRVILKVEDNGKGMEAEDRRRLQEKLDRPLSDLTGEHNIGLMNVLSRLRLQFDETARIVLERGSPRGLTVTLEWPANNREDEPR